jgi:ATP-dependent DNA ligase
MAKRTQTRFIARTIEGSKPSEMLGFIKPQLATLKSRAPKGDQRIHEIKYDGYRVQIDLNKGRVRVHTRNGLDWTKRFARGCLRDSCPACDFRRRSGCHQGRPDQLSRTPG